VNQSVKQINNVQLKILEQMPMDTKRMERV
jgi:hypothetical protein